MSASNGFLQSHLDRVSRSFAFCIRQLPPPLYEWVALSYLLCRVVDTIEDADWAEVTNQIELFGKFEQALQWPEKIEGLLDWQKHFVSGVSPAERELLKDAPQLLREFHLFKDPVKRRITDLVLSMSAGMQHFARERQSGVLRLQRLSDVNQYCFFVAGLVGELLAQLFSQVEGNFPMSRSTVLRAHHFGLFLQKVNLLKDQVGDEKAGRYFIPSRDGVERSALNDVVPAFEFLLQVPKTQIEFRRFCAWSLFLGLRSLKVSRDSLTERKVLKVSRDDLEVVFTEVEECVANDNQLRELFERNVAALAPADIDLPKNGSVPTWLTGIYKGLLQGPELQALGL